MSRPIGIVGAIGALLVLGGIALIGYVDPLLAAGLIAILIGVLLVLRDLVTNVLASFGLQGVV